ncbi:MAG: nitroreductase family protein [Devosia sp.]
MARNDALLSYLLNRRSVGIGFLRDPGPNAAELEQILIIGTRVPDHGKLAPWRLIILEGEARAEAGRRLAEIARRNNPNIDAASLEAESNQFLPAPLTIGVIFSHRPLAKAPELEQLLSAGAVAFNLCHAAAALGYAASWVTRWYAFDTAAQQMLGARGGERFIGFVHIGTPAIVPEDRERPKLETLVSRWQG